MVTDLTDLTDVTELATVTALDGQRICLTVQTTVDGQPPDRSPLMSLADRHGVQPADSVSRKRYKTLVAVDPLWASGEVEKARGLGNMTHSIDQFSAMGGKAT